MQSIEPQKRTTTPCPESANLALAAERIRVEPGDTVILEFFERRRRRAQAYRAREITNECAHYHHQHLGNHLAEIALELALEQERQAELQRMAAEQRYAAWCDGRA